MAWTIEYSALAERSLRHMDGREARRILNYMEKRVALFTDPRALGKALAGSMGGLWRYRVGDYRVVCEIHDRQIRILVVDIGHRREVYRRKK